MMDIHSIWTKTIPSSINATNNLSITFYRYYVGSVIMARPTWYNEIGMKKYKVEKTDDGKYKLVKKDATPVAKKSDKEIAGDALKARMEKGC